jgi:predicted dehydrogenase
VITDPFSYQAAVVRGRVKMPRYGQYSLENNIRVVQILDAARKSAVTGRTVKLENHPQKLPLHP